MSFLGEIEAFVADLYPYRWPITVGALITLAAIVAFGYRRRWHYAIWRHKLVSATILAAVLAASIPASDYFLSPLWERSFLEEESPLGVAVEDVPEADITSQTPPSGGDGVAADGSGDTGIAGETPSQPSVDDATPEFTARVAASGEFQGADSFHFGRGRKKAG